MNDEKSTPDVFRELKPHVREFLNSIEPKDVELIVSGLEFLKWFRTTGRITKVIVVFGLSVFGAVVAIGQGWEWMVTRWFGK